MRLLRCSGEVGRHTRYIPSPACGRGPTRPAVVSAILKPGKKKRHADDERDGGEGPKVSKLIRVNSAASRNDTQRALRRSARESSQISNSATPMTTTNSKIGASTASASSE